MTSRQWLRELTGRCEDASFWGRLDDGDRAALADVAESARYKRGEWLIRAEDIGDWIAVLCGGRVRVVDATGTRLLSTRVAGDILGEQALIDRHPRSTTVIASTAVRAVRVRAKEFDSLLTARPHLLRVLCEVLSERLREATAARSADADAFTRVVKYLALRAQEYPVGGSGSVPVHIKSQGELAALLGLSRESVVRALRRLRREGAVSTRHGFVVVRDPYLLGERPTSRDL